MGFDSVQIIAMGKMDLPFIDGIETESPVIKQCREAQRA